MGFLEMNIGVGKDITFTGVDKWTDVQELTDTDAEFGILYSVSRCGVDPRYPSVTCIYRLARAIKRPAMHVCGESARIELRDKEIRFADMFPRIQVNGTMGRDFVESLCGAYPDQKIITQHTEANIDLLNVSAENHQILVDSSGGRGLFSPIHLDSFPRSSKRFGYAGGLNIDNIGDVAYSLGTWYNDFWLDLETGVRCNDVFDTSLMRRIYELFGKATQVK